ncbi:serine hydrolase domain-containing protein [Paenibacillus humicola]|uniref:serine hydrolase domain-containing protein n=1 Tax=Paenibacillus humicola TaxID=3110540 RepID=UPI00237A6AAA|nr:serine hydrolase [Paenibacillus humicola]
MTNNTNSLPRSLPEEQGISSASLLTFLEEIERRQLELHGLMILRHGHIVAEGWWKPYRPQIPHAVYSITKSFTSIAAGFAVQEGLIAVKDRVLTYFPEMNTHELKENMRDLTIRNLLTMTTGHQTDTARFGVTPDFLNHAAEVRVGDRYDGDYVRGFLELPLQKAPGTWFLYNSGASHLLGAIVERVTGVRLVDYLQPRLYEPLGIGKPSWDRAPNGGNTGGWGLRLKTEDLARFGQFLLNKGVWNGERLLPAAWIEEATSCQVPNATETGNTDWIQGYGYQFWRCRHNAYRGDGAFGQYCIVMPDQDAVIAINGGLQDMQGVLDAVWEHVLPAMKGPQFESDPTEQEKLVRKLGSLELGDKYSMGKSVWTGTKTYRLHENEQGLKRISLTFADDRCVFEWLDGHGAHSLACGLDNWITANRSGKSVAVKGGWRDAETFAMYVYQVDSPHHDRLTFRFNEDTVTVQHSHLNFADVKHEFIGAAVKDSSV